MMDSGSVDALCAALKGRDEAEAVSAARQLALDSSPATIAALIEALGRGDLRAAEAAFSLAVIGEPAVPALIDRLRSGDPTTRWHAARALAAIASPEAVPALINALHDESADVRWEAVYGLSAIGLPALAPLLRAICTAREITPWFAEGAQRVLRRLMPLAPGLGLDRLIHMLEHVQEYIAAPLEANRILDQLNSR